MRDLTKAFLTCNEGAWFACFDQTDHMHSAECHWKSVNCYDVKKHIGNMQAELAKYQAVVSAAKELYRYTHVSDEPVYGNDAMKVFRQAVRQLKED